MPIIFASRGMLYYIGFVYEHRRYMTVTRPPLAKTIRRTQRVLQQDKASDTQSSPLQRSQDSTLYTPQCLRASNSRHEKNWSHLTCWQCGSVCLLRRRIEYDAQIGLKRGRWRRWRGRASHADWDLHFTFVSSLLVDIKAVDWGFLQDVCAPHGKRAIARCVLEWQVLGHVVDLLVVLLAVKLFEGHHDDHSCCHK